MIPTLIIAALPLLLNGQALTAASDPAGDANDRVFWFLPNYRTWPEQAPYTSLTTKEKFGLGAKDTFDRGTLAISAITAGYGQLIDSDPSFGQGIAGYSRRFETAFADQLVQRMMKEAVYPTLLRQDPRYFRRGTGGRFSRLRYAVRQTFWTHNDSGRMQFNYSEVLGASTSVAISNAYYPDSRTPGDAASKLGIQIGIDMGANVLKEFWPDLNRKIARIAKKRAPPPD